MIAIGTTPTLSSVCPDDGIGVFAVPSKAMQDQSKSVPSKYVPEGPLRQALASQGMDPRLSWTWMRQSIKPCRTFMNAVKPPRETEYAKQCHQPQLLSSCGVWPPLQTCFSEFPHPSFLGPSEHISPFASLSYTSRPQALWLCTPLVRWPQGRLGHQATWSLSMCPTPGQRCKQKIAEVDCSETSSALGKAKTATSDASIASSSLEANLAK